MFYESAESIVGTSGAGGAGGSTTTPVHDQLFEDVREWDALGQDSNVSDANSGNVCQSTELEESANPPSGQLAAAPDQRLKQHQQQQYQQEHQQQHRPSVPQVEPPPQIAVNQIPPQQIPGLSVPNPEVPAGVQFAPLPPMSGGTNQASFANLPPGLTAQLMQIQEELRAQMQYQVAWELKTWKEAEKAKWAAKLQEVEVERLRELEAEWRKQEIIREQAFARRQKEITRLEKKLKEALFDVEKQEKRLRLGEEELQKRTAMLNTEIDSVKKAAQLEIQRLKDQHKHQLGMVRMVHDELRRQYDLVKSRLVAAQTRYNELDEEFRVYKSRWHKSNVGQLRAALQEKDLEIKDITNQLTNAQNAVKELRTQLVRALQETVRLKKEREQEQEERLQLERKDLHRLRLQYLAKQQELGVRRDAAELDSIKRELNALLAGETSSARPNQRSGSDIIAQLLAETELPTSNQAPSTATFGNLNQPNSGLSQVASMLPEGGPAPNLSPLGADRTDSAQFNAELLSRYVPQGAAVAAATSASRQGKVDALLSAVAHPPPGEVSAARLALETAGLAEIQKQQNAMQSLAADPNSYSRVPVTEHDIAAAAFLQGASDPTSTAMLMGDVLGQAGSFAPQPAVQTTTTTNVIPPNPTAGITQARTVTTTTTTTVPTGPLNAAGTPSLASQQIARAFAEQTVMPRHPGGNRHSSTPQQVAQDYAAARAASELVSNADVAAAAEAKQTKVANKVVHSYQQYSNQASEPSSALLKGNAWTIPMGNSDLSSLAPSTSQVNPPPLNLQSEIARLENERQQLLACKMFTIDDPVIRDLDTRLSALKGALAAAGSHPPSQAPSSVTIHS